jgi:hypothetical protein
VTRTQSRCRDRARPAPGPGGRAPEASPTRNGRRRFGLAGLGLGSGRRPGTPSGVPPTSVSLSEFPEMPQARPAPLPGQGPGRRWRGALEPRRPAPGGGSPVARRRGYRHGIQLTWTEPPGLGLLDAAGPGGSCQIHFHGHGLARRGPGPPAALRRRRDDGTSSSAGPAACGDRPNDLAV